MGNGHTDPEVKQAYRSCGAAMTTLVLGMIGFAAWSLSGLPAVPASDDTVWLRIKHYALNRIVLVEGLEAAFMLLMAGILIVLCRRARTRSLQHIQEMNAKLRDDYQKTKKHESELQDANRDLQRFNAMATGREQRILELKDEVNTLLQEMQKPKRYNTTPAD
jgi:hypothetical protein